MPDPIKPGDEGAAGGEADVKKLMAQVAELSDAMKAKDAQFDTLKETYERTNALLQTMVENGGRTPGQGSGGGAGRRDEISLGRDFASEFSIPNEAVQAIVGEAMKVARTEFDGRFVTMQQAAKQRDAFYKDNPDLVGSEFLVSSISTQVDQELPGKSIAEKFKEVAKRSRDVIKRYQDAHSNGDDDTGQPVGAGGGSRDGDAGAGGGGGGGSEGQALNPEAELASEIAERNKLRINRGPRR